jgi:hypothetical protein
LGEALLDEAALFGESRFAGAGDAKAEGNS